MLSSVVTVLSLGIMLLIVSSLIISAFREHRRRMKALAVQEQIPPHALDRHVTAILHMRDGVVVGVDKPTRSPMFTLPSSRYTRHRALVSGGLLLMVVFILFVQGGLTDGALQNLSNDLNLLGLSHASTTDIQTAAHSIRVNASQQLVRISQLDPNQYASTEEFNTWAYSACSAAAMTEVFNAYGHHFRVTDVLQVEARIGEISPSLGLLQAVGIERTAAQFGFKTTWGNNLTIEQVLDTANAGKPVIVDFPPDRYAGGHILVVTGGNSTTIYLADTSLWNRHAITRAQFLYWWKGFAAVVTPR